LWLLHTDHALPSARSAAPYDDRDGKWGASRIPHLTLTLICTAHCARRKLDLFAKTLGLNSSVSEDIPSEHRKIGTSKNNEFSERFRAENQEFMDQIHAERIEMLSRYD
jgi:hypothetical protein